MLDWLFGRKHKLQDYGFLHTDMHAHWLFGIDDGAATVEDSVQMVRRMGEMGYRKLIATPHVMAEYYPNRPDVIRERLAVVRSAVAEAGIKIELDAAAEYMIDQDFEQQAAEFGLLTLPGNRVLVEFGFLAPPAGLEGILFRLQTARYRPVIAHPERYGYYHGKLDELKALRAKGVELQVNLLSLAGHYGSRVKKEAEQLMAGGIVSFLGTDAHSLDHLTVLQSSLGKRKFAGQLHRYPMQNRELHD